MIDRHLVNEITGIKQEIDLLQAQVQLIHDHLRLSCVCEINAGVKVTQEVANRLWNAFEKLENIESHLVDEDLTQWEKQHSGVAA
ncbi:hypothetical protein [Thiofilum flexile]|uniref:hypothetical protein n=1 Tax=Thiofilum flexile TaxID=125627 RepID=UPI0013A52DD6|nr:hypothetical protein [Thiofilum flexile]